MTAKMNSELPVCCVPVTFTLLSFDFKFQTFICNDPFMFYTFSVQPLRKVCLANRNIGQICLNTFNFSSLLPSIFSILNNLLIQVYNRSGNTHRFVAVELKILIVFLSMPVCFTSYFVLLRCLLAPVSVEQAT